MGRVISRGPTNLLAWSLEPDRNPPWGISRASVPSINNPDPQGLNQAAIIHEDGSLANTHELRPNMDWEYGKAYCLSLVGKAINRNWVRLTIPVTGGGWAYFNLSTGAIGTTAGALLDCNTKDLGDDWYRVWISCFCQQNISVYAPIYIASADNVNIYDGQDIDAFYFWASQMNYGATPDPITLTREVAIS